MGASIRDRRFLSLPHREQAIDSAIAAKQGWPLERPDRGESLGIDACGDPK
jgi:hypothetical protein